MTGTVIPVDGGSARAAVKASTSRWLAPLRRGAPRRVLFLWRSPSTGDYLYVPNEAQPVAGKVVVQGEKAEKGPGGDLLRRRHRSQGALVERLLPFLRPDGATLVPAQAVTATRRDLRGAARRRRAPRCSARREVAAAVALRAGRPTTSRRRRQGVMIEAVATDVPAAKVISQRRRDRRRRRAGTSRPSSSCSTRRRARARAKPQARAQARRPDRRALGRDGGRPRRPKRAIIGIPCLAGGEDQAAPLKVDIDLGNVGGPSAGLPFALQIYQELGHDVDHGHRIAATGEIELDGSVVSVGGIKQKTYGVRSSGADVFLVPAGENAATARRYAGGVAGYPCGEFSTGVACTENTSRRNSLFAGILPGRATPAICGVFVSRRGLAGTPGRGQNPRCP